MQREVYNEKTDARLRTDTATPECGQDFCDRCGDCLHCYGSDPCVNGHENHRWVYYEQLTSNAKTIEKEPS